MQNLNRIPLNGLRAIEAAGRLGSLRAAAEELGVTVGAVSQQVHKSELQLGHRLFERLPRGLLPTPMGEAVLQHLSAGFRELSAAVARAQERSDRVLTVSVAPVLAGKWLVWRLHRFTEQHPGIQLRVDANVALVDPDTSDVDVCIRVGRSGGQGVRAEKLIDHKVFPVCSAQVAERLGEPADLSDVPIIVDQKAMFSWNDWLNPHRLDDSMLGDGPVFSDASLCIDAAVAGQGVFLAWETLANDAVRAGRLVAPFAGRQPTGLHYWFVTARTRPVSPAARSFRRWIRNELRATVGE